MTIATDDLTRQLRASDPLLNEPVLDVRHSARMRRALLDAAEAPARRMPRIGRLALAASFVGAVMLGVFAARHTTRGANEPLFTAIPASAVTQVHFSTPGGTRIIWTLDPAFDLAGARP